MYRLLAWEGWVAVAVLIAGAFFTYVRRARRQRAREGVYRQTQEALRASEDRLRLALEATSEVVWDWDVARDSLYHPGWCKAYGYPPERTPQSMEEVRQFLCPDDGEAIDAAMRPVFEGAQETMEFEHRVRCASGEWRWMLGRARVVERGARGEVLRMVGTCSDITQRKRSEEILRASEESARRREERFRQLADAMPQLVWTAMPDGRVDYYNRRRTEFLVGQDALEWVPMVHPEDLAATVAAWRHANETGTEYEMEHRLRKADGRYYWHVSRAVPIRNGCGEVVKWYGTATDVDVLKQAEQQLRDDDQRKNEFLALLGHELRNPLAAMTHAIKALRLRASKGAGIEEPMEVLERQVTNSSRLLDDLLDVARITCGKIHLRKAPIRLELLIRAAVESQRAFFEGARHQLAVTVPPASVVVDADATRIEQILANLLNNAAKYTPDRGRIDLVLEAVEGQAVVRVRDNGLGISPELLPKIFDLFIQAEATRARGQGGLGLGLTLVRSLVRLHGGTVDARSEGLGKGCEFVVKLPLSTCPVEAATPRARPARPAVSRRVLVVDDNLDAAEMLQEVLAAHGHEVETAHDGASALLAAREFEPDVMLLDIGLPGIDGYEVARRLRLELDDKTPFMVAMTGYGHDEDRHRSRAAGIAVHLTKPFDLGLLEQIIQEGVARMPGSPLLWLDGE